MNHSIAARRRPAAGRIVQRIPAVCIVDARVEDYAAWQTIAASNGVEFNSVATAAEGLRLSRTATIDLWVVNAELPGLSGHELCKMLKAHSPSAAVCVVTDEYSAAQELEALRAGATLYACKPGHLELLDQWLRSKSDISNLRSEI